MSTPTTPPELLVGIDTTGWDLSEWPAEEIGDQAEASEGEA